MVLSLLGLTFFCGLISYYIWSWISAILFYPLALAVVICISTFLGHQLLGVWCYMAHHNMYVLVSHLKWSKQRSICSNTLTQPLPQTRSCQFLYAPQNLKTIYNAEWALVTGASSGIGLAIATKLAEQGFNVIIAAIKNEMLKTSTDTLQQRFPHQVRF